MLALNKVHCAHRVLICYLCTFVVVVLDDVANRWRLRTQSTAHMSFMYLRLLFLNASLTSHNTHPIDNYNSFRLNENYFYPKPNKSRKKNGSTSTHGAGDWQTPRTIQLISNMHQQKANLY